MTEKHGIFFLIMGVLIFILSLYVVTKDPIIGGVGLIVGLWNLFLGYRTYKGNPLFKSKDD